MTKILLLALCTSAVASAAAAQTVAGTPRPAPTPFPDVAIVVPPAPPAAPAVPVTPLLPEPPVVWPGDVSFEYDAGAWALKDSLKVQAQAFALAQAPAPKPRPFNGASDESLYDQARSLIERNQYERALTVLDRVIENRGGRADAAMYWKGYSLSKLARRTEALAVLADLQKQFPTGAWVKDARALEVEIRQASGQSVSADVADDEVKLLALRGLMQNDPDTAVPMIEKMLAGNSSVRVKNRALFVISQSRSPRARDIIAGVASSASNPELRESAVRYLAMRSDPESLKILSDVYTSTNDADLKRTIIRSLMGASATDRLAQIARTEKDPDLQQTAIRNLGASNRAEAAESLRGIYQSNVPVETKKTVIQALSMHQNASVLVDLAKAEKNLELKTEMVRRLSVMRSPEARDYMLELLK